MEKPCARNAHPIHREMPRMVNANTADTDAGMTMGPYALLGRVAEGGMGQVFKARHRTTGRIVALKVIRREVLANPIAIPRFEREVKACAQLRHPHVVRSFDAGKADGTYYLAMEFLEGVDLLKMVERLGPLSVAQACDYLRQAALGLQHAYELGFVHRDLKPANLFVSRKPRAEAVVPGGSAQIPRPSTTECPWGVLKILDFGLARLTMPDDTDGQAALTQVGSLMGTPDFLAPEQAFDSHTIDIRADLYSLGCTFYFLMAGRVPFPGGSLTEKLVRQRKDEPMPVDMARRERLLEIGKTDRAASSAQVPDAIVAILRKLMAKNPADRFQTPAELAAALDTRPKFDRPTPLRLQRPTAATLRRPGDSLRATPIRLPSRQEFVETLLICPTQTAPGSKKNPRLRRALVTSGFLLCCALSGRVITSDSVSVQGGQLATAAKVAPTQPGTSTPAPIPKK
jgi:serine/threonine-protein kinase